MRKAICKYCGQEFEYSNRGRARVHCRKKECLKQAKNEAQKKWYANKIQKELNGVPVRVVEKENKPQIVYSSKDREEYRTNKEDFSDIIEVARRLGSVRFELNELLGKESKKQSLYDKQDQDFLHKLESLDELTEEAAIQMIVEEKRNREIRRGHKIRVQMLSTMLNTVVKNPNAYVVETIKNRDNFTYKTRIKENEGNKKR